MTDELCIARLKLTSGERKKVGMKTAREFSASKWFILKIPKGVYAPEATDNRNSFEDNGLVIFRRKYFIVKRNIDNLLMDTHAFM